MKSSNLPLRGTLMLSLAIAVAGCSWFKRPVPYADSQEAGTLQVPEHLDRPSSDPSLSVPAGGTGGRLLDESAQLPPELGAQTGSSVTSAQLESFSVSAESGAVFQDVGRALEGMSEFPIVASDPVQGIYRVEVLVPSTESRRWYKFWSKPKPVRAQLVVRVERGGDTTTVSVGNASGEASALSQASDLLERLRSALGAS